MRKGHSYGEAPPSMPAGSRLEPPPVGKSPEVRAAEIIAASLDRVAEAIERLADAVTMGVRP